ncbi:NAD(P)-binding domain-containing protein [Paraburkholderia sp. Ac-20347]|uniref:flavin-containing monooxygenase n=1 Tax=Paraburkholderia sp. Ac-20347 TaxID=2703892 RepID=UPI001980CE44|nr:NAD(P)-binding domain-containing protein [Paraburkholderia sp. Ac-20347]MBN3808524.1 NAD(P)-binding domain-containing protein [Paraburkholderia sp. Ac-20347]
MTKQARYCVIGAGAAGLAALKTLTDAGIAVDCFEKSDRVGGHWHHDYDALHLITPKNSSFFDDFPMPESYPMYPSRDQVAAYMVSYAEHFGLTPMIRFNTAVKRLDPLGERGTDGWRVALSDGTTRDYAGVLVANGHLWDQSIPAVGQGFTGRSIHSGSYRNTTDIEGRVLVVGFGNSGCDLAVDAAQSRLDVTIAMRCGQVFQPKTFYGLPRVEVPYLNALPPELQNMATSTLIQTVLGTYENYPGMPKPETYDLEKQPPVVNSLLLYWIQHGRIKVAPGLRAIEGKRVTFTDGTEREYDTILWATGFKTTLPFLDSSLLEWRDGVPLRTAAMTLPTGLESLYFVGLAAPRGAQWPVYCAQSQLISQFIALREQGVEGLASRISKEQDAESRIDIVRRVWQQNLDETRRTLETIAQQHASSAVSTQAEAQLAI